MTSSAFDEAQTRDAVQSGVLVELDELRTGEDHDRAERDHRQQAQERREQQEEQHQGGRGDEARELRPAAGGVVHRGARLAGADGKALEEAGRQIRRRERPQLLLRADVVAVLVRERAREQDPVREREQRDADRAGKQVAEVGARDHGERRVRQPARHVADDRDAERLEIERRRGGDREDEDHQRARQPGCDAAKDAEQREESDPERQRRHVGLAKLAGRAPRAAERSRARGA